MNFENLKNTLQESIFTWDYFTDFEKVKINVKKVEKDIYNLNLVLHLVYTMKYHLKF